MQKYERRVLKLDLYGDILSIKYPSAKISYEYELDLADEKVGVLKAAENFFEKLGVSSEVVREIEAEHLFEIIAILTGAKKK
jgi:hypothetical protein